jgi:hypothetical protein
MVKQQARESIHRPGSSHLWHLVPPPVQQAVIKVTANNYLSSIPGTILSFFAGAIQKQPGAYAVFASRHRMTQNLILRIV